MGPAPGRGAQAPAFRLGGELVEAGERRRIELGLGGLPTRHGLELSVVVLNGERAGPRLWLSAAVHGDELNGIEIIREVLEQVVIGKIGRASGRDRG